MIRYNYKSYLKLFPMLANISNILFLNTTCSVKTFFSECG